MGLFSRSAEPKGYQPTDAEIADAARQLNAGSHHAAYDLTLHAGDYQQQTAMRILGACVDEQG
ncbi:hypothetical protein [Streptomyces lavendofoliae]|uniref:Uncharacterized protein n=1 Tax=Streptomyces lavendofoliae TaxID=67314 RepID=A0A918I0J4_9ACTN|nr:hypothetical protein [Streptomyces lavendofoliae]GGU52421.1 hypothetical protein GCM10010274_46680 [Streptomyces lavendofoliae]